MTKPVAEIRHVSGSLSQDDAAAVVQAIVQYGSSKVSAPNRVAEGILRLLDRIRGTPIGGRPSSWGHPTRIIFDIGVGPDGTILANTHALVDDATVSALEYKLKRGVSGWEITSERSVRGR
jgi:hypothetical protein